MLKEDYIDMKKSRFLSAMLVVCMAISFFCSTYTYAAETEDCITHISENTAERTIPEDAIVETYEVTLNSTNGNSSGEIAPISYYGPETFTFSGGERRGADHYMDGNYMAYEVTIRLADGSTTDNVNVWIKVDKYSGNMPLSDWIAYHPDGITHKEDWITFKGGGTCFFRYAYTDSPYMGPVTITLTTYSWS